MREEIGQRPPPEDAYRMALDRIHEGLDANARLVLQLAAVLGRPAQRPGACTRSWTWDSA